MRCHARRDLGDGRLLGSVQTRGIRDDVDRGLGEHACRLRLHPEALVHIDRADPLLDLGRGLGVRRADFRQRPMCVGDQ